MTFPAFLVSTAHGLNGAPLRPHHARLEEHLDRSFRRKLAEVFLGGYPVWLFLGNQKETLFFVWAGGLFRGCPIWRHAQCLLHLLLLQSKASAALVSPSQHRLNPNHLDAWSRKDPRLVPGIDHHVPRSSTHQDGRLRQVPNDLWLGRLLGDFSIATRRTRRMSQLSQLLLATFQANLTVAVVTPGVDES